MKNISRFLYSVALISMIISCKDTSELPYLGQASIVDGVEVKHTVGQFSHYNQDSVLMTNKDFEEYVYVADFFFTSCPSICPTVAKEMLKIYDAFKSEPLVKLVSFTIDPVRDDVNKLRLYADNLGVAHDKWYFLTGDKEATFALANTYFVAALEDPTAPGGFDHSGKIILVDKKGHVRSFSEGTDPESTPKLIADIQKLLNTYRPNPSK
ncbi:MAG: SCO family protein [Saprospiraceae bacterium]